jgi:uncharacterized protein (TIGR02246 family)
MTSVPAALYRRVQEFYAAQMQAVDGGDGVAYAATFAPDAIFTSNALPAPVHGRSTIEASTTKLTHARLAAGTVRRHLQTTLVVDPHPDGSLAARSYVLLVETAADHGAELYLSTVCEDSLVPDGDTWLVARRSVLRDDLP